MFVEEMTLLLLQKWARGQRKRKKKEEKKNPGKVHWDTKQSLM